MNDSGYFHLNCVQFVDVVVVTLIRITLQCNKKNIVSVKVTRHEQIEHNRNQQHIHFIEIETEQLKSEIYFLSIKLLIRS